MNRVPVFVGTYSAGLPRIADTEKNKDAQRQPPAVPGQTGNDGVAEFFAGKPAAAAQEHKQTGKVDRCSPGELKKVKKYPWPAGGDDLMRTRVVHKPNLIFLNFLYGIQYIVKL